MALSCSTFFSDSAGTSRSETLSFSISSDDIHPFFSSFPETEVFNDEKVEFEFELREMGPGVLPLNFVLIRR